MQTTFQPTLQSSPPLRTTTLLTFLFFLSLGIPLHYLTTHVHRDTTAFHLTPTEPPSKQTENGIQIPYPAFGLNIVLTLVVKDRRGRVTWEVEEALSRNQPLSVSF